MKTGFLLWFAAAVLPLVFALWGRRAAVLGAAGAVAILAVGGALLPGGASLPLLQAMGPLLVVSLLTGWVNTSSRLKEGEEGRAVALPSIEDLKRRHAELKETVAREEREEQGALQIYGVAKSLAESLSWKEMGPRLAHGIQRVFSAHDYLLYAVESTGAMRHLDRRGNWNREPPIRTIPSAPDLLTPPHVPELVPVLVIPVVAGEGKPVSGVLFLKIGSTQRTKDEWIRLGAECGAQLGGAIAKARLFNSMEQQSRVDGLTGTLRRQEFMNRLAEEIKRARAFRTPFGILMIDIDHFKRVNDEHGHAAGDAVLAHVGKVLRESFYETDVVGRYGGEEFIVLLPRAERDGMLRKAEALRHRLEESVIQAGLEQLRITVSVGLSRFPESGADEESLVGAADRALYTAKESGRNRVVAA